MIDMTNMIDMTDMIDALAGGAFHQADARGRVAARPGP